MIEGTIKTTEIKAGFRFIFDVLFERAEYGFIKFFYTYFIQLLNYQLHNLILNFRRCNEVRLLTYTIAPSKII
jgi:hypothetical protein